MYGFIAVNIDVFKEAQSTLNYALHKGQYREIVKVLVVGDDEEVKKIYEHEGPVVNLEELTKYDKVSSESGEGEDVMPTPEKGQGSSVNIHNHPTASGIAESGNVNYCDAKTPSQEDRSLFVDFDMNIIVGKNGYVGTTSFSDDRGNLIVNVEDERPAAINFFDSSGNYNGSISGGAAEKILSGDKGKHFKKFNKAKEKQKK